LAPTVLFSTLVVPVNAYAFMDAPALVATAPAMLALILPIIIFETYLFSRTIHAPRKAIAKASAITVIVAFLGMVLLGRLHHAALDYMWFNAGVPLDNISVHKIITPTIADILFNCTLGSALLVQRTGYFPINIVVISVFLLPTMLIYYFSSMYFLRRMAKGLSRAALKRLVLKAKLYEYAALVIASLFFAWRYIYG